MTGIGRYTFELAKGLRDSEFIEDIKYQFLLGWADSPESLVQKYHMEKSPPAKSYSHLRQHLYSAARSVYRAVSPTIQGKLANAHKGYIYHSPSYVLPYFDGRCVSTVHDMSIFRVPHYHPNHRILYQATVFKHLVKKGELFITDSEFSRNELLDFFPVSEDRVVSVPLGADPVFQPRSVQAIARALARFDLEPGNYTLCVGTIEPRKNIERLITAYARLPEDIRGAWPLVLVGSRGWNSEHIHSKINEYRREGWLKYLSFVNDIDLPLIYSGARLFAFLSHYEGFGLPVLEAMASGIPVVASKAASLPEVGGDAVLYVSPDNDEEIAHVLEATLTNDAVLQSLSIRGLQQAKKFSWGRTVNETVDAYRRIV